MKKFIALAIFFCLASTTISWANHGDKGKDCGSQCPIASKAMKKASFYLSQKDELKLSDDQVNTLKTTKADLEKSNIQMEAAMKTSMIDLEQKLSEETVDVEGLNAMIDKNMAGFAQGAKESIAAYAKIKTTLTDEQRAKAKELWKSKKGDSDCSKGACSHEKCNKDHKKK